MTAKEQLDGKITAIADAIRSKTGGGVELTLDGMAEAVAGIEVCSPDVQSSSARIEVRITSHTWTSRIVSLPSPYPDSDYYVGLTKWVDDRNTNGISNPSVGFYIDNKTSSSFTLNMIGRTSGNVFPTYSFVAVHL